MRRFLGLAVIAALVFAMSAAVFAPVVVFFGVRSAADAGDVQALSRLTDFSAVRTALRPQMGTEPYPRRLPPSCTTPSAPSVAASRTWPRPGALIPTSI